MLYAGTAKVNITPLRPTPLAGYGARAGLGPYEAVASPIFANIVCFRHVADGADVAEVADAAAVAAGTSRETSVVLVSADLLWWGSERIEQMKSRIRDVYPFDHILLHATHSHSGPHIAERFIESLGKADRDYIPYVEEKVLAGIAEAAGATEPVVAERGSGACAIARNRRKYRGKEPGSWVYPEQPIDREVTVLRYTTPDGRVKALLTHYTCHPVTNTQNVLSAEFPGAAARALEQELGGGAVCIYLQGTCGDINPTDGENWCFGGEEEVRMVGAIFANAVRDVLQSPMERLREAPLAGETKPIVLPLQPVPDRSTLEQLVSEPDIAGEWSRKLLQFPDLAAPYRIMEATLVVLAEDAALLTMNGEMVSHYGLYIKELTHKHVLPMGYTNGMIGYVPTARQLEEGGYEPITSTRLFILPAPYDSAAENIAKSGLRGMLEKYGMIGGPVERTE